MTIGENTMFSINKKAFTATNLFILILALNGCNNGGSSSSGNDNPNTDSEPETAQGVFLDSAVEGLDYTSGSTSGTTNATGQFTYEVGNPVTFSIGGIVIGTVSGKDTITPVDLVEGATDETTPAVTNIARFLQTLDDDGDPDNGILITDDVIALASDLEVDFDQSITDFENDGSVQTIISSLTAVTSAGARMLATVAEAQAHLSDTLLALDTDTSSALTLSGTGAIDPPSEGRPATSFEPTGFEDGGLLIWTDDAGTEIVIGVSGTNCAQVQLYTDDTIGGVWTSSALPDGCAVSSNGVVFDTVTLTESLTTANAHDREQTEIILNGTLIRE
jgi:hypothetical protein